MFSSKNIASFAVDFSVLHPLKVELHKHFSVLLKFTKYQPEVLGFINSFDYGSLGSSFFSQDKSEQIKQLFKLWDDQDRDQNFAKYYREINQHRLNPDDFSFEKLIPMFVKTNDEATPQNQNTKNMLGNPYYNYYLKLKNASNLKTLFASVLNIHNHYDAHRKLTLQTKLEKIAEQVSGSLKSDNLMSIYEGASEQQWYFTYIENDQDRKEIMSKFIKNNPRLQYRLSLCLALAQVPYGNMGLKKISTMARAYDLQFMTLLGQYDFMLPGVGKTVSKIVEDLQHDDSVEAQHLKNKALEFWLDSNQKYRNIWLKYLIDKYSLPADRSDDLEVYLFPLIYAWSKELEKSISKRVQYSRNIEHTEKPINLVSQQQKELTLA